MSQASAAWTLLEPQIGLTAIANVDSGFVPPNQSTAIPTPPNELGRVVRAKSSTFGVGEFILLSGVASTAVGSVVTYDTGTFATTLAAVGSNKPRPVAIAMAAVTTTGNFGWYQIGGQAQAKKTSALALASNAAVGVLTAGLIAATASGKEVQGALTVAKATTPKLVTLLLDRPHLQGRIT
jgi:hypothetical protein